MVSAAHYPPAGQPELGSVRPALGRPRCPAPAQARPAGGCHGRVRTQPVERRRDRRRARGRPPLRRPLRPGPLAGHCGRRPPRGPAAGRWRPIRAAADAAGHRRRGLRRGPPSAPACCATAASTAWPSPRTPASSLPEPKPLLPRSTRPASGLSDDSEAAQPDVGDRVVAALGQHERRPVACRQDVLDEVRLVDVLPDAAGRLARLGVGERRVAVEVRVRVGEGRLAQPEEPLDVPGAQLVGRGVDVDREVEVVGERPDGCCAPSAPSPAGAR